MQRPVPRQTTRLLSQSPSDADWASISRHTRNASYVPPAAALSSRCLSHEVCAAAVSRIISSHEIPQTCGRNRYVVPIIRGRMSTHHTFIFAGGGTGGHLYPGLAIARELDQLIAASNHHVRTLFVASDRPLDTQILSAESVEFLTLPARPFGVRPRALLRFFRNWGRAVRESRSIIRSEVERARDKTAVHVVAMGGFVAAPFVQAARVERARVTLVNLDAVPGKANRLIAKRADRVFTSARVAGAHARAARTWTEVPPIVRPTAAAKGSKTECRARLGLHPDRLTLLVTGGSQGAQSINQLMLRWLAEKADSLTGNTASNREHTPHAWQILHQCGKNHDAELIAAYERAGVRAIVRQFVSEIGDWWGAADLCVSRCGAGSVGEAWANHVPAIFLPYPYHRDEHQKHNAAVMVERGAAVLITDRIESNLTMPEFERALMPLLTTPPALDAMVRKTQLLGPASGARQIAEALLQA